MLTEQQLQAGPDGALVVRNDLVEEVWNGRAVSDDPINRAIREVRKCFRDSAKDPTVVATLPKTWPSTVAPGAFA